MVRPTCSMMSSGGCVMSSACSMNWMMTSTSSDSSYGMVRWSASNIYVGLIHLELSSTSTKRSNAEGNGSRLSISYDNNIFGVRNSEGREGPLRREFIIKEWNGLLEVEAMRRLGR